MIQQCGTKFRHYTQDLHAGRDLLLASFPLHSRNAGVVVERPTELYKGERTY